MSKANQNYPHHEADWAKTAKGTLIDCFSSFSLTDTPREPAILLIGGVHGDEPEGVRLANETLQWLSSEKPENLQPWILIPCINPDGFSKGERTNSNGVDLNRNYPTNCWTPEHSKPRYFPGSQAGSELETQALVALIERHHPKLIIHCHSFEPCVVYSGISGKTVAQKLAEASGYPCQENIGYDCPGSLGDYGADHKDIGVVCIEADHNGDLESVWPRFQAGIKWTFSK